MNDATANLLDHYETVTDSNEVPFTELDRAMLVEIHDTLRQFRQALEGLSPMLESLQNSPIAGMLGL